MSDSLIQFPAIASGASFAGTCLMHTIMFTETILSDFQLSRGTREPRESAARLKLLLPRPPLENERGVGAAKSKRIRKCVLHGCLARAIRNVIQVALGIRIFEIDGRRQNLIAQRQRADAGFQSARSAKTLFRARVSITSPIGVDVPCAFT